MFSAFNACFHNINMYMFVFFVRVFVCDALSRRYRRMRTHQILSVSMLVSHLRFQTIDFYSNPQIEYAVE